MAKKAKFQAYVVTKGRIPGIYEDWESTIAQVSGFSCAYQRGYATMEAAVQAWEEHLRTVVAPQSSAIKEEESDLPSLRGASDVLVKSESDRPADNSSFSIKRQFSDIDLAGSDDAERVAKKHKVEDSDTEEEETFASGNGNEPRVVLSPEQEAVAELALNGHNIFLTGAGGCGKTVTIKEIMARLTKKKVYYQVVAPTGISALPLGGTTTYSFMGWDHDSMRETLEDLWYLPSEKKKDVMREIQVLIIEEISMVENQVLERMNWILQKVLGNDRPFGGKQVIILGDFHQLPPVKPFEFCVECGNTILRSRDLNFDWTCGVCKRFFVESNKWAFRAPIWEALDLRHLRLEKIHRQKDGVFKNILDKIRYGRDLDPDDWQILEKPKHLPEDLCAVRLMARRSQVDETNRQELAAISEPSRSWTAIDPPYRKLHPFSKHDPSRPWATYDPRKHHRLPKILTLKKGAKVVLLHNLDIEKGLVNGTQGVVVGFQRFDGVHPEPEIRHVPGNQKWGYKGNRTNYQTMSTPVVKFANNMTIPVAAVEAKSRYGTNARPYLGIRVQVPLKLAWALTIHKSQGMTLNFIEVDSRDIFERGQLYVALSRGTSIDGVTLTGFSRDQLPCDEDVLDFYETTKWETFDEDEHDNKTKVKIEETTKSLPSTLRLTKEEPTSPNEDRNQTQSTQIKPEVENSQAEGGTVVGSVRIKNEPASSNEEVIAWHFDPPLLEGAEDLNTNSIKKREGEYEEMYWTAESRATSEEPEALEISKYFSKVSADA